MPFILEGGIKMKFPVKGVLAFLGAALLVLSMAMPLLGDEEKEKVKEKGVDVTLTGYISDSMCGLDHTDMMKKHGGEAAFDEKTCVEACVKGGAKYVLADREGRKTYNVKDQSKVAEFAGQRVQIVGEVEEGGSIDIHKITLAPK